MRSPDPEWEPETDPIFAKVGAPSQGDINPFVGCGDVGEGELFGRSTHERGGATPGERAARHVGTALYCASSRICRRLMWI
jgi:hypothetical protein